MTEHGDALGDGGADLYPKQREYPIGFESSISMSISKLCSIGWNVELMLC